MTDRLSPAPETQSLQRPSDPLELARRPAAGPSRGFVDTPDRIGPYKILQVLGEGGMGVVYLAEQERPIHRSVALKIIKLGMDTKSVIARFEAEREALALMNHPNVAKVFDAGATDTGRPYFAMEYVHGTPITEYCDKHRLTTDERLRLFIDVCHAVQHAHQKGIIHRDIKPSNVLVTQVDDKPSVKVIDFGIAKATQQRLAEATYFTEHGQVIGTPSYMSPEQASGSGQTDVDTRADVYSLGVLLYEMLVGALPFASEELRGPAFTEFIRTITEVDPPKPSARLAAMGETSTTIADSRGTSSRTLLREIRGDLDWIVMKCLEKDRTRRYDTVNALALEIGRYLNSEPVLAGPPSASYRVRKFIRRNRGSVLAAAIVVFVLIAGLTGTTFGLIQAQRERARAEEARDDESAQRKIAEGEKAKAVAARDEAEAVTQFLSDTLASVDPGKEGKDVTVREVMEKAANRVGEKFSASPLIEAHLRQTIGSTYYSLGCLDAAQAHLGEAAAIYTRELGPRDARTLTVAGNLAAVVGELGHFSRAEAAQRGTLEIQRRVLGAEHPDTLAFMNNLATNLYSQGRYAEAEDLNRQTLEIQRRVLGAEHPNTLASMGNLANSLHDQGRYAEAEQLDRQTLEIQRRILGAEHPNTLRSMNNLASSLRDQGRYAEADQLDRQTLEIKRRVLGAEHPATLVSLHNLARSLQGQGRYAEADELYRQTLEIQRRVLGTEHPETLMSMNNLANSLADQSRHAEAEQLRRQTLEIQRRVLGAEHPDTLMSMNNLANSLYNQSRYAEAEELRRQTLEVRRRVLGAEHPYTLRSMNNLANGLQDQGRYAEAEELYRQTLEIRRRVLGTEHPETAATVMGLAELLEKTQRHAEAQPLCREAGSILTARLPEEHRTRRYNDNLLGGILAGLGHFVGAEPLLIESYEALESDAGLEPGKRRTMLERLVRLYESWDSAEPGKGFAEKAAEYRELLEAEQAKVESQAAAGATTPPKSDTIATPSD